MCDFPALPGEPWGPAQRPAAGAGRGRGGSTRIYPQAQSRGSVPCSWHFWLLEQPHPTLLPACHQDTGSGVSLDSGEVRKFPVPQFSPL